MLASCGLAESVVESRIDDQDVDLYVQGGLSGTLVRRVDGTDVGTEGGLRPGDRASDDQALAVLVFRIAPSVQPDMTRLESIRLRFWLEPGSGAPDPLAPLVVSHLPGHPNAALAPGQVPAPPGNGVRALDDVTTPGWREVDVTGHFLTDWNGGRTVSAYAVRFATPTDDDGAPDDVDLDAEVGGQPRRAHLRLFFRVDL